ncbi:MAG: hypothetical protein IAG13_20710 [Deltaproteobacteria bacterium]|nr:hypothetical protein [Nannocystaceae bacterium]
MHGIMLRQWVNDNVPVGLILRDLHGREWELHEFGWRVPGDGKRIVYMPGLLRGMTRGGMLASAATGTLVAVAIFVVSGHREAESLRTASASKEAVRRRSSPSRSHDPPVSPRPRELREEPVGKEEVQEQSKDGASAAAAVEGPLNLSTDSGPHGVSPAIFEKRFAVALENAGLSGDYVVECDEDPCVAWTRDQAIAEGHNELRTEFSASMGGPASGVVVWGLAHGFENGEIVAVFSATPSNPGILDADVGAPPRVQSVLARLVDQGPRR